MLFMTTGQNRALERMMTEVPNFQPRRRGVIIVGELQQQNECTQYSYILSRSQQLNKKARNRLCVDNIIGYVKYLEESILKDDLVQQRLHRNPDRYLDSFRNCAKQMRELLSDSATGQQTESEFQSEKQEMMM